MLGFVVRQGEAPVARPYYQGHIVTPRPPEIFLVVHARERVVIATHVEDCPRGHDVVRAVWPR